MIEIDKRMEDAILRRKNGMKLEISPEVQAVIDKIPAELRPIDRLIKDSEMSVYNVFSVQMFGFKPSPIDDFGIDRNIYMKKKEEYHDVRQHVNENALDDMLSDPTFFQSKAESIFREWMTICSQTDIRTNQPFGNHLFTLMQNHGIAITEENILKQIKTCLEICTDVSYRLLSRVDNSPITANVRNRCYYTIDPFSKLVCLLIRNAESISNTNKLQLLHRTLSLLTSSLLTDHDVRRREFNGLPFLRIFITMIKDLCQHDPTIIQYHWNIIESFGQALYNIQPRRVPAFAFHWLEIIGHRVFITELLADPNAPHLTRAMYTQLLLAHLKFLAPSLRNVILPKAVQDLYRGTLRVMLVVLHDFPELLCEFYYVFCDVIPPNCVQLRNLVLSAFPRNMKLPDPFGQNFSQAENIEDMDIIPKVPYEMFNLIPEQLRNQLDSYLTNRLDLEFLLDLSNKLESSNISGSKYNVPVLNAIVNFVGIRAITQLKESNNRISISSIAHSSYMDVFQNLSIAFCTEGRYLLFNALANQLRYPNAQTHYFACTILYLFKEATTDAIREQITRILFERLVSSRPHPWGLLITFIELVRNEQYKFWSYEFVHCSPEIERSVKSFTNNIAKKQSTDVVDYS
jgi:CCR4-NOT transcription complex subunit 1